MSRLDFLTYGMTEFGQGEGTGSVCRRSEGLEVGAQYPHARASDLDVPCGFRKPHGTGNCGEGERRHVLRIDVCPDLTSFLTSRER